MSKKNVLMFLTDGQRTDALGCYGSPIAQTPNLDAFAGEGTLLRRSFCSHSVCMPTRASIFTSRYPHIHGVWANGVALPRTEVTMPQVLAGSGYATCAAGKVHFEPQEAYRGTAPRISPDEPYYGFDECHMTENTLGQEYVDFIRAECPDMLDRALKRDSMPAAYHDLQWSTDQTIDFMSRKSAEDQPFFAVCSYHELCPPCTTPEGWSGFFDPADVTVPVLSEEDLDKKPPFFRECYEGYVANGRQPDEEKLRQWIASYHDQMRFIDHQFGRLVASLEELGIWDDTIVVFTGDHGLSLNDHWQWRHGPFLFDEITNVPMVWRIPGMADSGAALDELVESVDIMPTVLELCGADAPAGTQGRSIAPLLAGQPGAMGRESVLLQERQAPDLDARDLEPDDIYQVGVRTADRKLIHYVNYPHGELYDLVNDPGEFNNLWYDPIHRGSRLEMESLLMDRLAAAQDPLPEREYGW